MAMMLVVYCCSDGVEAVYLEFGAMRHYGSGHICRKGCIAHSKRFAKCNTRQTTYSIQRPAKRLFAVGRFSGTRQRVCRVLKSTGQIFFHKINFKIENKKYLS